MLEQVASGDRPYACEIWMTGQCLVAPARMVREPGFGAAAEDLRSLGWPVFLRNTGGDITPQGFGTVNISISFALPQGTRPTIEGGFGVLCAPIFSELESVGHQGRYASVAGSFCDGAYNVVVDERKIAGTAQRWRRFHSQPGRYAVFAHALLLFDTDLTRSVAAVNGLRAACGRRDEIRADAHVNLSALDRVERKSGSLDTLANRLKENYESELERLTCPAPSLPSGSWRPVPRSGLDENDLMRPHT